MKNAIKRNGNRKAFNRYGRKKYRERQSIVISKYDLIDKISLFRIENKFKDVNELEKILYKSIQKDKLEDIHTYEIKINYNIAKKYFKNIIRP